jgi:hypothetical protein
MKALPAGSFAASLILRFRLCLVELNSTGALPRVRNKWRRRKHRRKAEASGGNYETLVATWHAHSVLLGGIAQPFAFAIS